MAEVGAGDRDVWWFMDNGLIRKWFVVSRTVNGVTKRYIEYRDEMPTTEGNLTHG